MNLKKFVEEILSSKEQTEDKGESLPPSVKAEFNGLLKCTVIVLNEGGKPVIQLYDDNGNLIAIADIRK